MFMKIIRQSKAAAAAFLQDDPAGTAAKTAFYVQLAILPLLLLFVSILETGEALWQLFPAGVAEMLRGPEAHASGNMTVSIVMLGTTAFTASSALYALSRGVRRILGITEPNMIKGRIRAAVLLAMLATLPLAGTLLPIVTGSGWHVFSELAMLFLFLCMLYFMASNRWKSNREKWALAGAAGSTAAVWMLLTRGFELYLRLFFRQNVVFGGIGAFMALGIWLYAVCFVILLGAALYRCFLDGFGI
jgi:uncharacterized BrkB/YihY/UPF0761 family membrane protein